MGLHFRLCMDKHRENLANRRCRYGNCYIQPTEKKADKFNYYNEFKELFGIDLTADSPDLHPKLICNRHKALFGRARSALSSGVSYVPSTLPYEFTIHSEQCVVCNVFSPESKKKKGPGPGRGHDGRGNLKDKTGEQPFTYTEEVPEYGKPEKCLALFRKIDPGNRRLFISKLVQELSNDEKNNLAKELGQSISDEIITEAKSLKGHHRSLDNLLNFKVDEFIATRNTILYEFIKSVTNIPDTKERQSLCHLAQIFENFYKLTQPNLVYPLAFLNNLYVYVETGSRNVVDLIGAATGGGDYDTIGASLKSQSSEPVACPDGDVGNAFDNNQKVGKAWAVQINSEVQTSVITTHIWMQLNQNGSLQKNVISCQENIFSIKIPLKRVQELNDPLFEQLDTLHYEQLYYIIDDNTKSIIPLQYFHDGQFTNEIDKKIEEIEREETKIKCNNCFKSIGVDVFFPKSKRVCDVCHENLRSYENEKLKRETTTTVKPKANLFLASIDKNKNQLRKSVTTIDNEKNIEHRYEHIKSNHPLIHPPLIVGEPTFRNPNSYASCSEVLRKIGKEGELFRCGGTKRHWMIVGCDGLPFRLCLHIIQNTFTCSMCHTSHFQVENYQKHCNLFHNGQVSFCFEFDWVLLKVAGGHFEMNAIKSFFELNWEPFLSELSNLMGFKSEAAQLVAKKCTDNHKAWQMILIFFFGSLNELIIDYLRAIFTGSFPLTTIVTLTDHPTAQGFISYCKSKSDNANFMYLVNQVTNYAQAIINFGMGMRRNNVKLSNSAVHKLSDLFHGRNHPFYQLIEVYYTAGMIGYPNEVRELLDRFFTISMSNDESKGEDWDFILENINKVTQSWVPKGVPNEAMWTTACRNTDKLMNLSKPHHELLGVKKRVELGYRNQNLKDCIELWQISLRRSKYLTRGGDSLTSVKGKVLDPQLLHFTKLARIKRYYNISRQFLNEEIPDDPELLHPVYITTEENLKYNDISRMSKDAIQGTILNKIENILCKEVRRFFLTKLESEVKNTISALVQFNTEIEEYIRDQPDQDDES